VRTTPVRILPLFELQLKVEFEHEELGTCVHRIKGSARQGCFLNEQLSFPHRGLWGVRRVSLCLTDQFATTCFMWDLEGPLVQQPITVHPPLTAEEGLPVLSSCQRSGDTVIDVHDRRGEHFDLKQYHPSDGMRKIVWKIYAKSGKLVSRHPEPSMTPEGQVAAFCLAGLEDDAVCSSLLAYLRRLETLELEIFFGCEGMPAGQLARTAQAARQLLIASVWQTASSTKASLVCDLENFLAALGRSLQQDAVRRVLLFCGATRLRSQGMRDSFLACGAVLASMNIEPVFFVTAPQTGGGALPADSANDDITSRFLRLLLHDRSAPDRRPDLYPSFLSACLANHWQVMT
jgi:hypothetical protein